MQFKHIFTDLIPDVLEEHVIYISLEYKTIAHLCPSGCGNKVVLNIAPIGWSVMFDGDTVTLSPSIGNWNLPCKSHYWIRRSEVKWAPELTSEQIEKGRMFEDLDTRDYYEDTSTR